MSAADEQARCWDCGAKNDGYTAGDLDPANVPSEGAVSICLYCGAFSVFTGEVVLCDCEEGGHPVFLFRKPTDDEMLEFEGDPNLQAYRDALGVVRTELGGEPR